MPARQTRSASIPRKHRGSRANGDRSFPSGSSAGDGTCWLPGGDPEPSHHTDEPEERAVGERLTEKPDAEQRRRHRAEREEHGHAGWSGVLQGPKPEKIADAAGAADEENGSPSMSAEVRRIGEEILRTGKSREKHHRGEHG
jgi:hypothetical protein